MKKKIVLLKNLNYMFIIFFIIYFFFFFASIPIYFHRSYKLFRTYKKQQIDKKKKKKKNKILTTIQFTPPRLYSHLLFILYFQYLNQPYEGIIHVLNFNKNIYHNQTFPLMKLSKHFLNHNLMSFLQNRSCFGFVRY